MPVLSSRWNSVTYPEDISITDYVFEGAEKFGENIALVSHSQGKNILTKYLWGNCINSIVIFRVCETNLSVSFWTDFISNSFYCPQTKLRKGNVFTSVCQEFCPRGRGGVHTPLGRHPAGQTPLTGRHPPEHPCNSMPFSAAWAYYGQVLVFANAASLNGCVHGKVK